MINNDKVILTDIESERGQFILLCDYADIMLHKKAISEVDGKYFLYEVTPPFPTFEEYSKGDEFEEGKLLNVVDSWEDAYKAQHNP